MDDSYDGGCDWISDNCGAYMNTQPGFDIHGGTWVCSECGALNSVGADNVLDLLGMLLKGVHKFITRPLQEPPEDDD